MKLENRILADAFVAEVKEFVRRELGELKATSASASRVGDLMMEVAALRERVRVLEERERARVSKHVVRLAA